MILLDTHALLWWQAGGERLSARATREIERSDEVLVSPISCWEIAMLEAKGRIGLDRDVQVWVADLFDGDRIRMAHLSVQAAVRAGLLVSEGFPGDPADRFLYATAREMLVPFVTKDANIRSYARDAKEVRVVW